jgi:hypothetical protein
MLGGKITDGLIMFVYGVKLKEYGKHFIIETAKMNMALYTYSQKKN